MSTIISVPANKNGSNTTAPPDDCQSTPFPKAYNRVKTFLKEMLRNEIDLTTRDMAVAATKDTNINPLIQELGPKETVFQFRKQLLAYARNEWPFNNLVTGSNTLAWWELLREHPHAHVLAVSNQSSTYD
jgi:hypothetical protein